jgi:HEAT repeat protein
MIAVLALSLALFAAPVPASPPSSSALLAAAQDKLPAAQAEFVRASASGTAAQRRAALESFVALADVRAMGALIAEFSRASTELEEARSKARDLAYAVERRQIVVANLRELAERDPSAKTRIPREEERVAELRKELDAAASKRDDLDPWSDELSKGMARLIEALQPSPRKKAEDQAWQDAVEHPEWGVRAAAVDLVGRLGLPGTALRIVELIDKAHAERAKLQSRYSKTVEDVRKMERRLQTEAAANQGRPVAATQDQYERIKREASEVLRTQTRLDAFVAFAARAGGRALSKESGKELEKSLSKVLGLVAKPKNGARLSLLTLLANTTGDEVRSRVRALFEAEKDPAALVVLHEGVAALGDKSAEGVLLEKHLGHSDWLVRSSAATTLAKLRSKAAIEPLIERLDKEEGRLRSDIGRALTSLTAQDFRGNVALWRRWWQENGAAFVVAAEAPLKTSLEAAEEQRGVTFFGISTESQRVLFVLDLSGSMKFSMTPKNNPTDDPSRPYDEPGAGESSRLDVAKRDLLKAIGGLRDGARFNLVLFASDVWTWADDLVEMAPDKRLELSKFIESADAVGATNIYGALERAFEVAGASGGDAFTNPEIDTIYLLTDGKATVGVTADRDEILAFVRSRNQSARITIHTIGLSDAHDSVLMRRIAEENGGQYVGR